MLIKFMISCNVMKKTKIKTELFKKKLTFSQNFVEFDGCHGNVKDDGHKIYI